MPTLKPPPAAGANTLIFIFITVSLDAIGLGIIIPVLPDLLKEVADVGIGKAAQWGGVLTASYAVMQFISGPFLGSLSDRYGRRPILLIGLVALSLDYLIMGFANSIGLLLLGRLLAGVAGSTFVTANALIADVSAPEKRAANFGMIGAAFGVGFILGPVIGGLLGEYGTRVPFFAAATLAILNFTYGWFVLPETLSDNNRRDFSWAKSNPFSGILLVRRFPALAWIFAALFLFNIGHYVYPAIWSYWGNAVFGWSSFDIGVSLALVGIGFAIVQGWLIRIVIPRFGETRVAYGAFGVNILAFLLFGFITDSFTVYLMLPFVGLGALLTPAVSGILSNSVPENEQGMLQGVIAGLAAIATIISPLLMTNLFYEFTDSQRDWQLPGAPFLMAAVLCLFSVAAFHVGVRGGAVYDSSRESTARAET